MKLPQDNELEKKIIGAMLVDKRAIYDAMNIIKSPEAFYNEKNRAIFDSIKNLQKQSKPVDIWTITNEIKRNGYNIDDVYIIDLSMQVATGAHTSYHSQVLMDLYVKRLLIDITKKIQSKAFDESVDVSDIKNELNKDLINIDANILSNHNIKQFSELLEDVTEKIEVLSTLEQGEITGLDTGFSALNNYTNGWQNGTLNIIAARPSMGKTALVIRTLLENAKKNVPVALFSLETTALKITQRAAAINTDFDLYTFIKKGIKDEFSFKQWKIEQAKMSSYQFYIDDTAYLTIDTLKQRMIRMIRDYGVKLIAIDYLQLISVDKNFKGNREQAVSNISRELKVFAKEYDIPVIALSQLSRGVESRADKRPMMSDLRESGAIEQDADIISFLYRPEYYGLDTLHIIDADYPNYNTEMIIAKNKDGKVGSIGLTFNGSHVRFSDVAVSQF